VEHNVSSPQVPRYAVPHAVTWSLSCMQGRIHWSARRAAQADRQRAEERKRRAEERAAAIVAKREAQQQEADDEEEALQRAYGGGDEAADDRKAYDAGPDWREADDAVGPDVFDRCCSAEFASQRCTFQELFVSRKLSVDQSAGGQQSNTVWPM